MRSATTSPLNRNGPLTRSVKTAGKNWAGSAHQFLKIKIFMLIYKQFTFDSAHFLPNVPDGHKCREMHGHTYHLTLFIEGAVLDNEGWVLDFGDIKAVMKPIIDTLDHHLLN